MIASEALMQSPPIRGKMPQRESGPQTCFTEPVAGLTRDEAS
jgi:hypothetical protein